MRALQMPKLLVKSESLQALRAKAAFHSRQHSFDQAMRKMLKHRDGRVADSIVADLYAHWGDPLSQNDEVYVRSCLAEATAADGAILQCGTGLMTLLLGAVCDREDNKAKHVWCLENDEHWANMMRSWLTEYRIRKAHLINAPAESFVGYTWYGIDTNRLAKKYALVICDGARATPRGAIGTIKQIESRLADNFAILARNISKASELKYLAGWAKNRGASFAVVDRREGFVKLSQQSITHATDDDQKLPESPATAGANSA